MDLEGTYLRNGPGLLLNHPKVKRHNYDGDGMILSLAFHNGHAYFRNKFVRTQGFLEEQVEKGEELEGGGARGWVGGGQRVGERGPGGDGGGGRMARGRLRDKDSVAPFICI